MEIELTQEEKEVYEKIKEQGTMDDMFELAYAIGRANLSQENLDELKKE